MKTFCLSAANFRRGTLLCFGNFGGIETCYDKEGYLTFFCRTFRLIVLENFVDDSFCFSELSWFRKIFVTKEAAGITIFGQFFLSHGTETICRGILL